MTVRMRRRKQTLIEQRHRRLETYYKRAKILRESWPFPPSEKKVVIHLPSLGYPKRFFGEKCSILDYPQVGARDEKHFLPGFTANIRRMAADKVAWALTFFIYGIDGRSQGLLAIHIVNLSEGGGEGKPS